MSDRFKFRVWNKNTHSFTTGGAIKDGGLCFAYVVGEEELGIKLGEDQESYTIEQCTGLKDNCGNLIYEGDIIGDGEDDYVIKWDSNRTMFVAEDVDTSYEIEDVLDPTICVIGNIHEQAEQKE